MDYSLTLCHKSGSLSECHEVGYERLPNGLFRVVDFFDASDEYPVPVFEQSFNTEKEASAALNRRLEELARYGFTIKVPKFPKALF